MVEAKNITDLKVGLNPVAGNVEADLTRRSFLLSCVGVLMLRLTWAEDLDPPVLCWKLEDHENTARETMSGTRDAISSRAGHAVWVGQGRDRALRLDGYSVWINHVAKQLALRSRALTISAWMALESYPVDEAAIVQLGNQPEGEFRFSIDRWGYFQFGARQEGAWNVCKSANPVQKAKWTHLAATYGDSGTTLYQNGLPCGHGPASKYRPQFFKDVDFRLGRSPDCPVVAGTFPTGVLNGLLRDVRIFDGHLSARLIADIVEESSPGTVPDLQINGPWCSDDPQRPLYHALPPRAWTNEPHGLIHWGGQYHLFYQKNPNGPYWGHINWGHMTSPDLYRWTEMPVALSPEPGPDSEGCWSGSVLEHDGKLALIYTGGDSHRASICLAFSSDGISFTKFHGNPIIPQPPPGLNYFRVPRSLRVAGRRCVLPDHRLSGQERGRYCSPISIERSRVLGVSKAALRR
jgi:hypothetical protein